MTAELSMGQLLKMLSSLVRLRLHEASKLKEFDQLRIRAEKLDTRRGLIMHSSWAHPGHWADSSGVDPATHAMRTKTTAKVPSRLQLIFEAVTNQVERQVEGNLGIRTAPFVVPLAVTLFFYARSYLHPGVDGRTLPSSTPGRAGG